MELKQISVPRWVVGFIVASQLIFATLAFASSPPPGGTFLNAFCLPGFFIAFILPLHSPNWVIFATSGTVSALFYAFEIYVWIQNRKGPALLLVVTVAAIFLATLIVIEVEFGSFHLDAA